MMAMRHWSLLHKMTEPELALEPAIASLGVPYRCQHPLLGHFCDFALPTYKIVVEVDGKSHDDAEARAADKVRDAKMQTKGWKVVRLKNAEALENPFGWVEANVKPLLTKKEI